MVMEGTLKMCAVVEAGYPAIDAGSVTLWHGDSAEAEWETGDFGEPYLVGGFVREIDEFARRHLAGRRVAVVCDSDWDTNELVLQQTMQVVDTLVAHGANAVACAPPRVSRWVGTGRCVAGTSQERAACSTWRFAPSVGVDDWLGARAPP